MNSRLLNVMLVLLLSIATTFAQKGPFQELTVQSSVQCDMCKQKILKNLYTHKKEGIKNVQVNLTTKQVIVKYDSLKTTPDQIRTWISLLGYKADEVPANPDAYSKLPNCCK